MIRVNRLVTCAAMLALCATAGAARSANLLALRYEAETDALIATIAFRGTHAGHRFYLQWDRCRRTGEADVAWEVAARVIDRHGSDNAMQDYVVESRFPLAALACRPARVTVRASADPVRTVVVPRRPR